MRRMGVLVLALLLAGCLRLGEDDDLIFVCEEKSGSPRMAYGLDFLFAQTRGANVTDTQRLAILDAARPYVITMGGRPHEGFDATLDVVAEGGWRFEAFGVRENAPVDVYVVPIQDTSTGPRAFDAIEPPLSIRQIVARVLGTTATDMQAAWDPELPSCVLVVEGGTLIAVNVVQERVVLKR